MKLIFRWMPTQLKMNLDKECNMQKGGLCLET